MKLQKQKNGQYTLTVPQDLIKGFGWIKGQELEFSIAGKGQLLLKAKP